MKKSLLIILLCGLVGQATIYAQDSTSKPFVVAGNFGVTNNGISIVPTFSLKDPAFNFTGSLSIAGRFSLDPDVRMTFDGRKGGAMLWFRYKLIEGKKFHFRVGAHPAFNFALKTVTENNKSWNITQARRFIATELAPSYSVSKNFSIGAYYLHGNGLQKDGPISTHFVNFISSISGIQLGKNHLLSISPQAYYLQIDNQDGYYLTGNLILASKKSPFTLMYLYNKEITTNIVGSKPFDWNLTLMYNFNRSFRSLR